MVKYYGFPYQGKGSIYSIENESFFGTPYMALKNANDKWDATPDHQISRLLTVIVQEITNGERPHLNYAFFQFSDSNACEQFISEQDTIKWSESDKQVWNGEAHMM